MRYEVLSRGKNDDHEEDDDDDVRFSRSTA
jgi:hypothetical protein